MNLITFLDNRFQELAVSQQESQDYSPFKDAEASACRFALTTYLTILKAFFLPKIIFNYILVCAHLKKAPFAALVAKQNQAEAMKSAQTKVLGRSVGWNQKKEKSLSEFGAGNEPA